MASNNARILLGAKPIADYLGATARQVYNLVDHERLPVFRVGVKICAVPQALDDWLAAKAAESGVKHASKKDAA